MQIVQTIAEVREAVGAWRRRGEQVAFVPTMGNLHRGHISLVERAHQTAHRVVVSVFVNPLQFGAGEDFATYPRTPDEDAEKLRSAGVDVLFQPGEQEMYPRGRVGVTHVVVPEISKILCGVYRPGHFRGVATVVAKLLNIVQPDVALFGEKDYQQLLVIRRMVTDLNLPVEVLGVPTFREADGLALSSRNSYLSGDERATATGLYTALRQVTDHLAKGRRDFDQMEREAVAFLEKRGFRPDYVSIRRAADLLPPQGGPGRLVVLGAAHLGRTRLIDNLLVELD